MQRRRLVRVLTTSTVVLSVLLAGCAPGLAANPRFATDSGAQPQGQPPPPPPPEGPPQIEAPKNDLSWRDCTSRVFTEAAVDPIPGVTLDCATYDADLDPIKGATGSISIGVVRAKSDGHTGGRRTAGHDHRIGPADVDAAADLADAFRLRRA